MTAGSGPSKPVRVSRLMQVLGLVLVVAVLVVIGGVALLGNHGAPAADGAAASQRSTAPAAPAVQTPAVTSSPSERSGARSVPAPAAAAAPVAKALQPARIQIPAIGVDSRLTHLGIAGNGTIEVPDVPAEAGWLDRGPAPGQRGPAVIAGHVDSTSGPAVFYKLSDLEVGDAIIVTRTDGTKVRFTVDGLAAYPKKHFPTRATYGPVPGPALRLITCGGSYVKSQGGYLDNVVVFAT